MSEEWPIVVIFAITLAVFFKGLRYFRLLGGECRIPINQIELVDLVVRAPCAFSPRLMGKIRNKSTQYTLTEVVLQITVFDCRNDDCEIIGQGDELIWIKVPPGQEKKVVEYVHISNMRQPLGKISCQCEIICAKGR